jgi:DNA-directed RNA polymerase sigma subunit (sigma70/sigma32)
MTHENDWARMTDVTLSPQTLKAVRHRNRRYLSARERERAMRRELRQAMVAARNDGHTLAAIGNQLGVSPQRVAQILDEAA